jgi:hypothetical protein
VVLVQGDLRLTHQAQAVPVQRELRPDGPRHLRLRRVPRRCWMVSMQGDLRLTHQAQAVPVQRELRPDGPCHLRLRRVLRPCWTLLRKDQAPRQWTRGRTPVEGNLLLVLSPHIGILANPKKPQ